MIWPGFILIFIVIFYPQVLSFLNAINSRIEKGDSFNFYGFNLGDVSKAEMTKKINENVAEVENQNNPQEENNNAQNANFNFSLIDKNSNIALPESVKNAHIYAIKKLSKLLKTDIITEKKSYLGEGFIFDGVIIEKNKLKIIEVQYFRVNNYIFKSIESLINRINNFYSLLNENAKTNVSLIVVLVFNNDFDNMLILSSINPLKHKFEFPIEFQLFKYSDLQKEFQE